MTARPFLLLVLGLVLHRSHGAGVEWRGAVFEPATDGSNRLRLVRDAAGPPSRPLEIRVPTSRSWMAGWVPVFEVKRDGQFELRRRPPIGRENMTDPLFFALPPESDSESIGIAGRWQIQSTNSSGGRHWTSLELTSVSGRISGRFDQDTDYRFAFITGGTWGTNRLQIQVEYIQDRYELSAQVTSNRLHGTWRRPDDSERGTWAGRRELPDPPVLVPPQAVPLWEWRNETGRHRYGIEPGWTSPGWVRQEEPVCRVWRP